MMAHQRGNDEPGRTPGQAEGTRETVDEALRAKTGSAEPRDRVGQAGEARNVPPISPNPSQAEGSEETVEKALRKKS